MSSNKVKLDGGAINLAHFYREIGLPYLVKKVIMVSFATQHIAKSFAAMLTEIS